MSNEVPVLNASKAPDGEFYVMEPAGCDGMRDRMRELGVEP